MCDVQVEWLLKVIEGVFDQVLNFDEDCILCQFFGVINVIECMNYFFVDVNGELKLYLLFKFNLVKVFGLLELKLMFEIWVYLL